MLKIKDDVGLKELEKFGFKPIYYGIDNIIKYEYAHNPYEYAICVDVDNRKIYLDEFYTSDLNILYDLITAGLVEKIEERK